MFDRDVRQSRGAFLDLDRAGVPGVIVGCFDRAAAVFVAVDGFFGERVDSLGADGVLGVLVAALFDFNTRTAVFDLFVLHQAYIYRRDVTVGRLRKRDTSTCPVYFPFDLISVAMNVTKATALIVNAAGRPRLKLCHINVSKSYVNNDGFPLTFGVTNQLRTSPTET